MKTLVVLSALVSIALTAPAHQEEVFEVNEHVPDWRHQAFRNNPESIKRERKSPAELLTSTISHSGAPITESHNDASTTAARSFALKKPLIVKKKSGYSLYRDSEEEKAHADSHESCGRQVKVKLCDEGKFREMLRSEHEVDNIETSNDEMKLSIKMAKEAVENLQKDLMKIEHKNEAMKMAHDSKSDADLHVDIETARQALEHIHSNFENLESMRLRTTISRDPEIMDDVHITLAKSDEEKMAQWKEAVNNIKKNFEIARNIEDSFQDANHQENLLHLDQFESASTINEHELEEKSASHVPAAWGDEHHMRGAETAHLKMQTIDKNNNTHDNLDKATIEHFSGHHAREQQHVEDDMNPSASEAIEMKTVDIENEHTLKSENHRQHEHEKNTEGKLKEHFVDDHKNAIENIQKDQEFHQLQKNGESEFHMAVTTDPIKQPLSTKDAKEQMATKLKTDKHHNRNTHQGAPSTDSITISPTNTEHHRNMEEHMLSDKTEHHLQHEKSPDNTETFAGTNEQSGKQNTQKKVDLDVSITKSTEQLKPELDDHHSETLDIKSKKDSHIPLKKTENNEKKDDVSQSVQEIQLHKFHNIAQQHENFMKAAAHNLQDQRKYQKIDYNSSEETVLSGGMKSAEEFLHHHFTPMKSADHHMHHHTHAMKAAENHLHGIESIPTNGHWPHDQRHLASMKAAEEFNADLQGVDHMKNSHLTEHRYNQNKMGGFHEMSEHSHQHAHDHTRHHHNMMSHSNMHDINMAGGGFPSNFHSNMREAMDGFESEHTFRWMPSHESARNAYGAGLSGSVGSSSGAVGVFPNANAGGCGIPLLLSCSPSVVSGSLAKGHAVGSGYTAPSYRTEDDFTFHSKRDIKKPNDIRSTKVMRTPAILKQKTGTMLENKL